MAEPNYHPTKWFSKNLAAIEMNKTEVKKNKLVQTIKIIMYENRYNFTKTKDRDNVEIHYMDTDSLIFYVKPVNVYAGLAGDMKHWDMTISVYGEKQKCGRANELMNQVEV